MHEYAAGRATAAAAGAATSDTRPRVDRTTIVFLGLYLLLLAFFILLNSLAEIVDDKSKAVLDSVTSVFAEQLGPADFPDSVDDSISVNIGAKTYWDELSRLFKNQIPVIEIEAIKPFRVMAIRMPATAMFEAGSDAVGRENRAMLDRFALALASPPREFKVEIELIVGPSVSTPSAEFQGAALPLGIRRAGALVRYLVDIGAPPSALMMGVGAPGPDSVEIRLYMRDRRTPVVDFAGAGR